jgi:hypothetical protein
MVTFTDIQSWLRRNRDWALNAPKLAGPSWLVIKILASIAVIVAAVGFFTEHPAIALALGAVFFFYAVRTYELLEARWRRESLDHKLIFFGQMPTISGPVPGEGSVTCIFQIINNADYDIYYVVDDEAFSVGDDHAVPKLTSAVQIIPAKKGIGQSSTSITTRLPSEHNAVRFKLSVKYGRRKDKLEVRWFVIGESYLPGNVSSGRGAVPNGFSLTRNDFEWIV